MRRCAAVTVETSLLLARLARGEVRRHLPGTLTVLDMQALSYVERNAACGPSDVAGHLGLSAPSATKLLEPLVAQRLLTRSTGPDDRRRRALTLTALGHERLDAARLVTRAFMERRLAGLAASEVADVERAMAVLERLFEADVAD